ncbi:MAG: MAPEG family protein [Proteobacteria bacterium]|nr:MAPEG family protein [Pseudomonadota bacterium]
MPANALHLVAAALALVLLTFAVGISMFVVRVREVRRVGLRAVVDSRAMASQLQDVRAADNFRNLFEAPVLFYALIAMALAVRLWPSWLVDCAWIYVALRALHSLIHCTYNNVMHRLAAFATSLALLVVMWIAFFMSLLAIPG